MTATLTLPAGVMDPSYAAARVTKPQHQFRLRSRAMVVARAAGQYLPHQPLRLLEVGAAEGRTLLELASALPREDFVGLEYNADLIAAAPTLPRGVRLMQGDALHLPASLADSSFDLVSMLAILEHLAEPVAALRQSSRVLKPGGIVVATCPNPFWDKMAGRARLENFSHHVTSLGLCDLRRCLGEAGFEVLEAGRFMWAPLAFLPYLRLRVSPSMALKVDRVMNAIPVLRGLCVNAYVVGRKQKS